MTAEGKFKAVPCHGEHWCVQPFQI